MWLGSGTGSIPDFLLAAKARRDHANARRGDTRHSMLNMAAAQGYTNIIKKKLTRGGDVNAVTSDGRTALHCGAYWNQASVVDVLVAYGAHTDATDSRGFTPLHVASANGASGAIVALVQHGADKCKTNNDGLSPLLLAVQHARLAAATVLLHASEEDDEDFVDKRYGRDEYSALDLAARGGYQQMLRMIIRHGADVNAEDSDGVTALYLAALNDQACSIDLLVKAGAEVGAQSRGRHGRTPLHAASAEGSNEAVHALVTRGAAQFMRDSDLRTPLHLAVENGRVATVKLLLALGSDPSFCSDAREYEYSALDAAASQGCVGALRAMCEHLLRKKGPKALINLHYSLATALSVASSRDKAAAIDVLVEAGADIESERGISGTPVHFAAENDAPHAIAALARHGADVDNVGGKGRTALHTVAFLGFTSAAEALLAAGAAVADRCPYDEIQHSALDIAAEKGHVGVMRALIQHGGDAHAADPDNGTTALHFAAAFNKVDAIHVLAAARANLDAPDNVGCTPLHRACANNCCYAIAALAMYGANMNKRNNEGKAPLHQAAATPGRLGVVQLLLAAGADSTLRGGSGDEEATALHHAAKAGHIDVIEVLIEAGASVDAKNSSGSTALLHAVKANKSKAVDALLEAGADVEAHLNNGSWTSLHTAAEDIHLEVVQILLKHGANVHAKDADNGNDTPLHVAVRQAGMDGTYEIVQALLGHGADEGARNDNELTPVCVVGSVVSVAAVLPVMELLRRAPGDRAWRRRGLLVLCCARAKKTGTVASAISPQEQAAQDAREEAGGLGADSSGAGEGEGRKKQQRVKTAGTNDGFDGVVAWLLGLQEEGLFRTVVGFL